ncbi:MAG TPA: hypothetical protein VMF30_15475 [Pirellulales bacterium]|nr:hypothetical protein [Pirellulales bacterium]
MNEPTFSLPTGSCPGPISLPTVSSPIDGSQATQISGISISTANAGLSEITMTLSIEHGTLTLSEFDGVTVSGEGTSTLEVTGTEAQIDTALNPYSGPGYAVPAGETTPLSADSSDSSAAASDSTTSDTTGTGGVVSLPVYYNNGPGLSYTADSGFTGSDALTVSAVIPTPIGPINPVGPFIVLPQSDLNATYTSTLLLDVAPEAQAPVVTAPGYITVGDASPSIVFSSADSNAISISDPSVGTSVEVTLSATGGTLVLGGTTGVAITGQGNGTSSMVLTGTVANINAALDGLEYVAGPSTPLSQGDIQQVNSIVIVADDLGNTSLRTPQTDAATVNIVIPPLLVPTSAATPENTPLVFSTTNGNAIFLGNVSSIANTFQVVLSASDGTLTLSDTSGLTFTAGANDTGSMTIAGSASDLNSALAGLTYTPNAGFTGTDYVNVDLASLANSSDPWNLDLDHIGVQVGPGVSPPATTSPPAITAPSVQTVGLSTAVTFSSAAGNAISVADSGSNGAVEQLQLAVNNGTLTLSGIAGLTFSSGANGSSSMTIEGTVAAIDTALDGLVYTPVNLFVGEDTLSLTYTDATASATPETATSNVNLFVASPNEGAPVTAPTAIQNATPATPVVFTAADGNAISVSVPGLAATDPVEVTLSVGAGNLALSTTAGLTITAGANNSSSMTIEGTVAAVNQALDGLTYTPGLGCTMLSQTIYAPDVGLTALDVLVNVPGTTTVTVPQGSVWIQDGLNTPPATITVPATQNTQGSTPVVFSAANQNAISINDNGAGDQPVTVTLAATCTFGVSGAAGTPSGTLTLSSATGLTFAAGGNGTASMTFSGTVANVDQALGGLVYAPEAGNAYWDSISVSVTTAGSAGAQIAQSTVGVSPQLPPVETGVSDLYGSLGAPPQSMPAPVVTLPTTAYSITGSPTTISSLAISGAALVEVTLGVQNGILESPGAGGVIVLGSGTSSLTLIGTAADVDSAALTYIADAGFSGSDALTISATSLSDLPPPGIVAPTEGTPNAFAPLAPATPSWNPVESTTTVSTLALNVAPPTLSTPTQEQTVRAPNALVFSAANGNAISITDPNVGRQMVEVTLAVANGTLNLSSTAGLTFTGETENGDATLTFSGDVSDISAALAGLSYTPTSTYSGNDTLSVTYDELDAGSGQTLNSSVPINVLPAYVQPTIAVSVPSTPPAVDWWNGSLAGVSVSETGDGPLAPLEVTLSVSNGTLNVAPYTGVTVTGNDTSTLVLTGDAASIDTTLEGGFNILAVDDPDTSANVLEISGGLTYEANLGYTGTDTLSVSATAPDYDGSPTATGSATFDVTPGGGDVLLPSGASPTFTLGGSPVTIDPGIVVDPSQPDVYGAAVFATYSYGIADPGVTLGFTNQNGITGTFSNGVLSLSGVATAAEYQAALQSVTFSTTDSTTSPVAIQFAVYGSYGAAGNIPTVDVNVAASPAATSSVITPSVAAPSISTPSVSAPSVSAPSVSAPSVSAPSVSAPSVSAPSVGTPNDTTPNDTTQTDTTQSNTVSADTDPTGTDPTGTTQTNITPAVLSSFAVMQPSTGSTADEIQALHGRHESNADNSPSSGSSVEQPETTPPIPGNPALPVTPSAISALHGRHQSAASDAAWSAFDAADLYV